MIISALSFPPSLPSSLPPSLHPNLEALEVQECIQVRATGGVAIHHGDHVLPDSLGERRLLLQGKEGGREVGKEGGRKEGRDTSEGEDTSET